MNSNLLKYLMVGVLLLVIGCSDSTSNGDNNEIIPEGFAEVSGKLVVPNGVSSNEIKSAEIYLVGNKDKKVYSDNSGNFTILIEVSEENKNYLTSLRNSSPEKLYNGKDETNYEYELIIIAQSRAYGIVYSVGEVSNQGSVDLGNIELKKTGSVTGRAFLENNDDHTGIDIYFPGTEHFAKTDSDGKYSINNIPSGQYSHIRADKSGYYFSAVEDVVVVPDSVTTIPDIYLNLSTGAIGGIVIEGGSQYATSLEVDLSIYATTDAVLMMISENPNMFGGVWKPISAVANHTFNSPGYKTLYIKFADANGLESGIYFDNIVVDLNPSVILLEPVNSTSDFTPSFFWSESYLPNSRYHFQLSTSQNFSSTLVDSNFIDDNFYNYTEILSEGVNYYWRVAVIDEDNQQFGWSSATQFVVTPLMANLLEPQGVISEISPVFIWDEVGVASCNYHFQLSQDQSFSELIAEASNISNNSFLLNENLANLTSYYWRIAVIDDENYQHSWSPAKSFTIDIGTPTKLSPENNEVVVSSMPIFQWDGVDGFSYDLQISEDQNFNSLIVDISELNTPSYQLDNPLVSENEYYWRVRYRINGAVGVWSDNTIFEVIDATEIGGHITTNTTLTISDSPYYVSNDIIVDDNRKLTIEPGVTIYFAKSKGILVEGTLAAIGEENNSITFTGLKEEIGSWGQITFSETSSNGNYGSNGNYISGSGLSFCNILYGGGTNFGAITILESSPYISECNIAFSLNAGILLHIGDFNSIRNCDIHHNSIGISSPESFSFSSVLEISNCNIYSNNYHGVDLSNAGEIIIEDSVVELNEHTGIKTNVYTKLHIEGCTIQKNSLNNNSSSYSGGLYLDSYFSNSEVKINNNLIANNSGNRAGGICMFVEDNSEYVITNNVIRNNTGSALYTVGSPDDDTTIEFKNNTIEGNISEVCTIYSSIYQGQLSNNSFLNNIALSDTASTILLPSNNNIYQSSVDIYNNNFNNQSNRYEIRTNNEIGTGNINAKNNWWGTTDDAIIQDRIYDWNVNSSVSLIEYSPYLTEPYSGK